MKKLTEQQRKVMAEMGRRGGKAATKRPKGFAALTPARRKELSSQGIAAREKKE